MTPGFAGLSKDNWKSATTGYCCCLCCFIEKRARRKDVNLISVGETLCYVGRHGSGPIDVEKNHPSRSGKIKVDGHRWIPENKFFPLPYAGNEGVMNKVDTKLWFPIDKTKDELVSAVFAKDEPKLKNIVRQHYKENIIALSSHSPESVAFWVFTKGDEALINFAITIFKIDSVSLNSLRLGIGRWHPSEILVRRGEFEVLGNLIANQGLAIRGKRIDAGLKFNVSFNPIITALEDANNILVQRATKFLPEKWNWRNVHREDGATPVQLALSDGRIDLLQTLLNAKAPVNEPGWCDLTPLQFALDLDCEEEIAELLLKFGATAEGNI